MIDANDTTALQPASPDSGAFKGEIKVASRIIDYLSSGLYPSPGACLKELVNNSYDAGASRVDVFVKPDADRIIIEDDGTGLNKEEFKRHFSRISESHKRDDSDQAAYGRPKIGKIGIGFIAANEICEVMEIYSTKKGSTELLHVEIDFSEMRKPIEDRRREGDDFVKADYEGEVLLADSDEHYTQLFLKSVRGEAKEIMAGASSESRGADALSLYGLSPRSVLAVLKSPEVRNWKDLDAYSETMLEVGLNVPVRYYPDWIPANCQDDVEDFVEDVGFLNFDVFYDGAELFKPIVFRPPDKSAFVSKFEYTGELVSAKGYFYVQHGTIKPPELQGLLTRIRNAAVGGYDSQFWDFSPSEASVIQRWVSAEVWADDRLEEAMNIDRRTLRVAHPTYVELRRAIHKHLRLVLTQARTNIYQAGSTQRKQDRTDQAALEMTAFAKQVILPLAPAVAKRLVDFADTAPARTSTRKALQRKYSVVELYQAIIDVASDFLSKEQVEEVLKRLTERL